HGVFHLSSDKNYFIPKIVLRKKKIYLSKFDLDGEKYFVAFYGNGDNNEFTNCFKKIKIDSISKLVQANKFSWIKLDNTNKKYFSIGFYKKDMDEASMIIQIENKNDSSIKKL
ncbi:MAG: hypothetical protein N4A49_00160, partial [Marinifilaceae bacterium]|nr:hypothetical protein [Marinifilaceae bacterium]